MDRSTIENKFKWTIDEMYPDEKSMETDIEKVKKLDINFLHCLLRFPCIVLTFL